MLERDREVDNPSVALLLTGSSSHTSLYMTSTLLVLCALIYRPLFSPHKGTNNIYRALMFRVWQTLKLKQIFDWRIKLY